MTQKELAKASGVSQVTISYTENQLSEPMYLTKVRLARALKLSPEVIFPPDSNQAQVISTNRVLNYRGKRDMTQEELAKASGVCQVTISFIENMKTEPAENTKKRLAKALSVKVKEIFPPKSKPKKKTNPSFRLAG